MKAIRRQFRLVPYAMRHKRSAGTVVASMLLMIALDVAKPFPLKLLVDNVLGHKPIPGTVKLLPDADTPIRLLGWVVGATIFLFIVQTALDMISSYAATALGQR